MKFPIPNNGSILWIIQMPLKTYDGKTVLYHPLFGKFDTLARLVPWWAGRQADTSTGGGTVQYVQKQRQCQW